MEYEYGTEPFDHQRSLFEETREMAGHAILWEQGCGKTKPMIDTAAYLYEAGKIDAVLVVAPPGVERNWMTDEIPAHLPKRLISKTHCMLWRTIKSRTNWHEEEFKAALNRDGLVWLFISYNAFMSEVGKRAAWRFLKRRRCLYILDEADDVKTPKAKRTRSIIASGRYADYRRIMTGTPADKPFDLYSQLRFIDPDIWRRRQMASFHAFKHHYGVWFTRDQAKIELGYDPGYDRLLEYKNLEELAEILASVSDRLLKTDVFDLPPKLYTKRYFDMTPRQQSLYNQLRDELEIELDSGKIVDGNLAITRLLRLQQITCGYMVTDRDEPVELCDKTNPRLDCTVDFLNRLTHSSIIWCRFRHDVDQLVDALGDRACRYDGSLSDDECELSKLQFNGGERQHFVATTSKGSRGLTMNIAKTTTFYSNSFKYRDRVQAEDRNHRWGQDGAQHDGHGFGVLFCDVLADKTVDMSIVSNLRGKFDIAAKLTGDQLREWI